MQSPARIARTFVAVSVLALSTTLAACGGGDDGSGNGEAVGSP